MGERGKDYKLKRGIILFLCSFFYHDEYAWRSGLSRWQGEAAWHAAMDTAMKGLSNDIKK